MIFYASKNLQHDRLFRSEILCRSGIMLYLIAALGKKYNIGQCQLAGLADLTHIAGLFYTKQLNCLLINDSESIIIDSESFILRN